MINWSRKASPSVQEAVMEKKNINCKKEEKVGFIEDGANGNTAVAPSHALGGDK